MPTSQVQRVYGGAGDDTIYANSSHTGMLWYFHGDAGNDTYYGGIGGNVYYVQDVGDVVVPHPDSVGDLIHYSVVGVSEYTHVAGIDEIYVEVGSITITGDDTATVYYIEQTDTTIIGGGGDDSYYLFDFGNPEAVIDVAIVEQEGGGYDRMYVHTDGTIQNGVEALVSERGGTLVGSDREDELTISPYTIAGASALYGHGGNDTLQGGVADDLLDGGTGADTMTGNGGDDTYYVDDAGDMVFEDADTGTDTVVYTVTGAWTLAANVENAEVTAHGQTIAGNSLGNVFSGLDATDSVAGGDGDDTYRFLAGALGTVAELEGEGYDTIETDQDVDLRSGFDNIEAVIALADGQSVLGNDFANTITLTQGGFAAGGLGDDIYILLEPTDEFASAQVIEEGRDEGIDTVIVGRDFALTGNFENLTANSDAGLVLTGNGADSVITGGAGNDTLQSGLGDDTLDGRAGPDTADYSDATNGVRVDLGLVDAQDTGWGFDTLVDIENLTGSHFDDTLTGNASGNIIDGGLGADIMTGGAGWDTYYVDNAGDMVIEEADGGQDKVHSTVSYSLTDNVEQLDLEGDGLTGTGTDGDNTLSIRGNGGTLYGLGRDDYLYGSAGRTSSMAAPGSMSFTDMAATTSCMAAMARTEITCLPDRATIGSSGTTARTRSPQRWTPKALAATIMSRRAEETTISSSCRATT